MKSITLFNNKATLGATLLVTGCCIGAGMIGLPVVSAAAGFMPSAAAMALCYLFTTMTGLLILEATLWFDRWVNLSSIVEVTLGKACKLLTLLLFLSLFYCLFVAYLDGGGTLFQEMLSAALHTSVSREIGVLACALFVAAITYAGTKVVDGLNRGLLVGLVASYFLLVFAGLPEVKASNLAHVNMSAMFGTIPILLICFGYQNLVPSLTYYLRKNVNAIRFAIVAGNLLPFFVYLLWNFTILGMLPSADPAYLKDDNMVYQLLQGATHSLSILFLVKAFSLFALLTSFIPNAVSLADFLKDGFRKAFDEENSNGFLLYGLVFVPPLLCALYYPNLFLKALSFSGGFIDVLLFGVLPALVILVGRYHKKMAGPYQVAGGYVTPLLILLMSIVVLVMKLS